MKNKKWLLVIVSVVFFINISFIILTKVTKLDQIIQKRVSIFLAEKFDADVEIGYFTFSDKQANISNFKIKKEDFYNLEIKQIYVEYNLAKLLFSKFKNLRSIKQITILEPSLKVIIPSENTKKTFSLPEIEKFFQHLTLENGKIEIIMDNEQIQFEHKWDDFQISIDNKEKSEIEFKAKSPGSELTASCSIDDGDLFSAQLKLKDFVFDDFTFSKLDTIYAKINLKANYSKQRGLAYSGDLSNVITEKYNKPASAKEIKINGNLKETHINSNLLVDNNILKLSSKILNPLKENRTINANITTSKIEINRYISEIFGEISANIQIDGPISDPKIYAIVNSEQMTAYRQVATDIKVNADIGFKSLNFEIDNISWKNNYITGFGEYDYSKILDLNLSSPGFSYKQNNLAVIGNLSAKINYSNSLYSNLKIDDLSLNYGNMNLRDLTLSAILENDNYELSCNHLGGDLQFSSNGNIKTEEASALLKLNRFDLNNYFHKFDLPLLSGNVKINSADKLFFLDSTIHIFDQDFGKLDGIIGTEASLNLNNKISHLSIKTNNTRYNYEPFNIDFLANGTYDNFKTDKFTINDEIFIDSWFTKDENINYGFKLKGDDIRLKNYLKFGIHSYVANQIIGTTNFDINFDSEKENGIYGDIILNDFAYGNMEKLQAKMGFLGDLEQIDIKELSLNHKKSKLIDVSGKLNIIPELNIEASGIIDGLDISKIVPTSVIKGDIFANFDYKKSPHTGKINIDIHSDKLQISKTKIDTFRLSATQEDSVLTIHNLVAKSLRSRHYTIFSDSLFADSDELFSLSASGKLDYNFVTSSAFPSVNSLNIDFSGDIFNVLSKELNIVNSGKSSSSLNLNVDIGENGFSVNNGKITIDKASIDLSNQIEQIDKVKVDIDILDDKLNIEDFKFRMGEGKIYVSNEISDDDDNFVFGLLNMGKLKLHTSSSGILVHAPGFMPSNSVAKINIGGRYEENLLISGPFDDINIFGNIAISNGDAIFPPDTENLFKLFGKVTSSDKNNKLTKLDKSKKNINELLADEEKENLPFTLDIMADLDENVRYVTYPANLNMDPDSFIHIKYIDGKVIISDALFICKDGSADVFGTQMKTDYLKIQMNDVKQGVEISGNFYKKAFDGTIITFEIFDGNNGIGSPNLQFKLVSDNSNDGIMDVLSLLRYGRRVEDIGEGQKKSLLQDEVVNIIGIGIESAFLDPLISPIENRIRSFLKLDFFYLKTDIVQNVVSNFTNSDDQQYLVDEENQKDYSSLNYDDFLNNFSVNAGKYITQNLFIDYEARFEKKIEIDFTTKIGVYQFYSLRYDVPYNFRLIYQFQVQPFAKDTHQITLQKSIRF